MPTDYRILGAHIMRPDQRPAGALPPYIYVHLQVGKQAKYTPIILTPKQALALAQDLLQGIKHMDVLS